MKNAPSTESLFNTLKAENEPWLGEVFISLPAFERLKENHSVILYGEPGNGKTALRLELQRQKEMGIFSTLWTPEPILENSTTGTALAHQTMQQALRACVESLILEGNLPRHLREPSSHIASALQWFLRNYLPFEPAFYIQSQADKLTKDETRWFLKLAEQPLPPIITEKTSLKDQIHLLVMILRQAKYEQLWLIIDGLERWSPRQAGEQVMASLDAILSTLILFDAPEVAFKFFVPISFKGILHKTTGVERHRVEEVLLTWDADSLRTMLEKRMAYAISSDKVSMDSVCNSVEFLNWLKEFGGDSPLEWLRFTAPLIAEYRRLNKRLTTTETHKFIRQHPAPLRLQQERREVWLGKKCIPIGSATEFRVLEYLAARPGKICSLEELYYYSQAELETMPDKGDPKWVHKDTWRGAMDMTILRLRKKIEENYKEPLYLITHHGKGLELLYTHM